MKGILIIRAAIFLVVVFGLVWSVAKIPQAGSEDFLRHLSHVVLAGEKPSAPALKSYRESNIRDESFSCSSQLAGGIAVLEARLAQEALQDGRLIEYDMHFDNLSRNAGVALRCSPHNPLFWFLRFAADTTSGSFNSSSWKLLLTSYRLGPHEGWLMRFRNPVVVRLFDAAPSELQRAASSEFRLLIRDDLTDEAAISFSKAPADVRGALTKDLFGLDGWMLRKLENKADLPEGSLNVW